MAADYKIIGGDGREYAAASLEELRQWCVDGRVGPGTPVWRGDEERWAPAAARDELKWDLPKPSPPPRPPAPAPIVLQPAGFWVRLAALLFDMMFLGSLLAMVTTPWAAELKDAQEAALTEIRSASPNLAVVNHFLAIALPIDLISWLVYFVGFNAGFGGTPGKLVLGLRVLRANGDRLTFGRALLRLCSALLTVCSFGIGFILVAFTPEKRALHDLLADTRVVFWRPTSRLDRGATT